ncbi:sensor histidine kinase [Pelotalea chapellei]|uniref:histidine kinase n=1 Tax=Pelotalea chapellei TaxID=44671 RepID=A0ABS5UBZ7_9BACT|nr:ATP-binding protein [Pelotalea chapellei]MBT1073202.1 PAS domain S-box protein [Pelotalea chapellei]
MKPIQPDLDDNLEFQKRSLTDRQRKIIFSPLRLVVTLAVCIFLIEFMNMILIEKYTKLSVAQETLLDATFLTIALIPILYFYLFRPLLHLIKDYELTEGQLKSYQTQLEHKVAKRTRDLEDALENLRKENEKKRLTKLALSESEARFRQLFDQCEDAVILIEQESGAIIDINPTTEEIFRKQREDIMAGGLPVLCSQAEQFPRLKLILDDIARRNVSNLIDRFKCTVAPGEERILSFRGKPITLQGSKVVYATFRDITTRVRLEEEALEIQARLIQANRMTSLGQLVASVAHEINNPNNYILMNATLLQQTWRDIHSVLRDRFEREGDFMIGRTTFSEAATFLPEVYEGIAEGARRISEIVENLKEHGRDDRTLTQLTNLNEVVRLSVSLLNHMIARTTHHFTLELGENLPAVRSGLGQLQQVVINLITNALQALPDAEHGIRVSTGLSEDGQQVVLSIHDEGEGIPEKIASRIMEPFFTTRLDRGGTGLGLAICYNIVNDYGGTIEFDSEPGKGTTFTVSLQQAENCGDNARECHAGK